MNRSNRRRRSKELSQTVIQSADCLYFVCKKKIGKIHLNNFGIFFDRCPVEQHSERSDSKSYLRSIPSGTSNFPFLSSTWKNHQRGETILANEVGCLTKQIRFVCSQSSRKWSRTFTSEGLDRCRSRQDQPTVPKMGWITANRTWSRKSTLGSSKSGRGSSR